MPPLALDPRQIADRLTALDTAAICPRCRQLIAPLTADTRALLIEVTRLHEALKAARLESADRLAAMQAAIHAAREGEPDPLTYLADEMPDAGRGWGE
jgi:hypothetical protein